MVVPSGIRMDGWLDRVAKEGTFVKNADATWNATGANAIPSGWTVLTE